MDEKLIPVNIVTGFLGVGKTTAILELLSRRPAGESWAVLVNEFGKVPIDQATIRSTGEAGTQVAEVAGGCLCCTAGGNLHAALSTLLGEALPDRILVEPTGLGHPEGIREILFNGPFSKALRPATSICLLDARQYLNPRTRHIFAYWEQVKSADVLVLNKIDLADEEILQTCRIRIREDYPEKEHLVETQQGRLSHALLDRGTAERAGPVSGPGGEPAHHDEEAAVERLDGKARRLESSGLGRHGCGWVFSRDLCFSYDRIASLLNDLEKNSGGIPHRVKGVLHTDRGWRLYNAVGSETGWQEAAPFEDSRIEYISAEHPLDWLELEEQLFGCLL